MNINILTIFPDIFNVLNSGVVSKAIKQKLITINLSDIRKNAINKHNQVDSKPYGGGEGMVMMAEPLIKTIKNINTSKRGHIVYMSPQGTKLNQDKVISLSKLENLTIICGRYEGIDQRFIDYNEIEEISVGDYILSGGEIASFILIDACVRLIPEVLGNSKSLRSESFNDYLLEYSQYTKPSIWKKLKVPDVLLTGNHKKISDWRLNNSLEKTKKIRPDLYKLFVKEKKR